MRKPLSFLVSHELPGHWFVPQAEAPRAAGRFTFSANGYKLDLLSLLDESEEETEADDGVPVIFGCTSQGEAVSLFRSLHGGGGGLWFGSADEEVRTQFFRPHMAIVGAHIESEAQCFPAMRARVPGLLAWIGESGIGRPERIEDADGKSIGQTMTLVPGTISATEHDGIPGQVTITKFVSQDGERFSMLSWASEGWVEIRPTAPQPIDQLLRSLNQVLSLFGLFAGPCMHFDAVELTLADDRSAGLLFSPNRHRVCDVSRQWEFLIPFDLIRAKLPALVDAWLEHMPRIKTVNALFESAHTLEKPPLHLLFLTLTHVLEGLHRSSHSGVYMDPEGYKAVCHEITAGLPQSVVGDHRQSLKRRIEFGNEISFRKRLGELVDSLPDDLRLLVAGCTKGVPDAWITTRNEYTHWPNGSTSTAAEGAELYCINTRLLMLVRVLLLRVVGVAPGLIVSELRGRNRWARELAHVAERERRQKARRDRQDD